MAKRGRKKKSKVKSLSTADKNHLKRILAKVRQIKANKAAEVGSLPTVVNQNAVNSANQLLVAANQNLLRFISSGADLSKPTNLNTFNVLSKAVADAQARLIAAQMGKA